MNLKAINEVVDKGVEFLTSKKATYILLFLAVLIIGNFIIHPTMITNVDTITFAIPAYHLANGNGLSNAPCYAHGNENTFWHPPLYMVLQSVIYKLLGFNFFTMHILPIILWFIFIGLLYKYLPEDKKWVGLSSILFLSIVLNGISNRPDILMGIFAILLIVNTNVLVLGIIAGLALMTHAFGIIFFCYAFLKIILNNSLKINIKGILTKENTIKILQFSGIFIFVISPYLFYIGTNLDIFIEQFVYNNLINQSKNSFNIKNIINLYRLIFIPIVVYFFYEIIKNKEIKLAALFGIVIFIYTLFFAKYFGMFYRYAAAVFPFIIFSLNIENKKLVSLCILMNMIMLIAFLGVNMLSINSDNVYDCERNFKLIENKKEIDIGTSRFFLNTEGNCMNENSQKYIINLREEHYGNNENILNYTQTKLCNIYAFDFNRMKMVDYSYVIVEK